MDQIILCNLKALASGDKSTKNHQQTAVHLYG